MNQFINFILGLFNKNLYNIQYELIGSNKMRIALADKVYEVNVSDVTSLYTSAKINEKFFLSLIASRLIGFKFQEKTGFTIMRIGPSVLFTNHSKGKSYLLKCAKKDDITMMKPLLCKTCNDFLDRFNIVDAVFSKTDDRDLAVIVNAINNSCCNNDTVVKMYTNIDGLYRFDTSASFIMEYCPFTTSEVLNGDNSHQLFEITITSTTR